jgi:hypothetical protein
MLYWNKLYAEYMCRIFGKVDKTYGRFLLFHMDDTKYAVEMKPIHVK